MVFGTRARVVNGSAPFDRGTVSTDIVRVPLEEVAPGTECNRGRLGGARALARMGGAAHNDRARGLFVAEERVRVDAGGAHWGAVRETETVAERKVAPIGGLQDRPRLYVR